MASNKVTLILEVDDNGSLKLVSNEATKTTKALDGLTKSTNTLNKSKGQHNKLEKGVAGLGANSTKSFSKQAQMINGGGGSSLVAAYATLAANIFAITAAFGALKRAAALQQLEQGLVTVGNAAGQNLGIVASKLRDITGAAISTKEAMSSVAIGTSAGFSTAQLEGLTTVAKGASLALGRDMSDAMSRLVRGAAKLEPEILDELGIMVRLDSATQDYATSLGKTAGSLSQFERRMAFTNAIIDQGREKFGDIANSVDPNVYDQLSATFSDLLKNVLNFVNKGAGPLVKLIGGNQGILGAGALMFASTITGQMVPALYKGAQAAADSSSKFAKLAAEEFQSVAAFKNLPGEAKKAVKAIAEGGDAAKGFDTALKSTNKSISSHVAGIKKLEVAHDTDSAKLAKKKVDLKLMRAVRSEVTSAIYFQTVATIKQTEANAFEAISQKQLGVAIKFAKTAVQEHTRAMWVGIATSTGFGKANIFLSGSLKIAAFGVKLFGAAIMTYLPYIGLAVLAISTLAPLLTGLFEESEVTKAAKEAAEGFSSFAEIGDQLNKTLALAKSSTDAYVASLKVTVGVMGQISSAIATMQTAQYTAVSAQISSLVEERIKIENVLLSLEENASKGYDNQDIIDSYKKRREALNAEIGEASKGFNKFNKAAGTIIIEQAKASISANTTLSKLMADEYTKLEAISKKLANNGFENNEQLMNAVNEVMAPKAQIKSSIEAASSLYSQFSKDVIAYTNKASTPIDALVEGLGALNIEAGQTKASSEAMSAFEQSLPKEFVDRLYKMFALRDDDDIVTIINSAAKAMKSYQDTIVKADNKAKEHSENMKKLKGLMSISPEAVRLYYKEQELGTAAKIAGLRAELKTQEIINDTTGKGLKIQGKIRVLQASLTSEGVKRITESKAFLAQEKMTLDVYKKEATLIKSITSAKQSLLEEEIKKANLAASANSESTLTIEQKITVSDSSYIDRLTAVENETALKKSSIDLEYKLLRAKFALLKQESLNAGTNLEPSFVKEYESQLANAEAAANVLVAKEQELTTIQIENRKIEQDRIKIRKDELEAVLIPQANLQKSITVESIKQTTIIEGLAARSSLVSDKYKEQVDLNAMISEQKLLQLSIMAKQVALSQVGEGNTSAKNAIINEIAVLNAESLSLDQKIKQKERNVSDLGKLSNTLTENFGNGMASAFDNIITGTESVKEAFGNMAINVLKSLSKMLSEMMAVYVMQQVLGMVSKGATSATTVSAGAMTGTTAMDIGVAHARYGGILDNRGHVPGYAAGGVASGSSAGYPVTLHGTEAVVPLPDGKAIPVEMKGSTDINNVTVNVTVSDSGGNSSSDSTSSNSNMNKLGQLVSQAVQQELMKQKRPGGILSPYGAG